MILPERGPGRIKLLYGKGTEEIALVSIRYLWIALSIPEVHGSFEVFAANETPGVVL